MSEQNITETTERNHRKVLRGYVVSDKMDKTVTVEVDDRRKHPVYGKVITHTRRVKAMTRTTRSALAISSASWRPVR